MSKADNFSLKRCQRGNFPFLAEIINTWVIFDSEVNFVLCVIFDVL